MATPTSQTLESEALMPYEQGERSDPVADLVGLVEDNDVLGEQIEAEDDDAPEIEDAAADDDSEDDTDADESEDDDEADDQPRYKVKANGEEIEVPLDELIRGYSRQVDYTRKTSEVARIREATQREKAQAAEKLMMMSRVAERLSPQDREIMAQEWEAQRAEYEAVSAELRQEYVAEQARLLAEAVPEWTEDPERATAEKRAIGEYAVSIGIPPEVVREIADHTAIVTLRKAMLYDSLQSKGKDAIRSKVASAPVLGPGGRPNHKGGAVKRKAAENQRAVKRAESTGRLDDWAKAFEPLFDD